MRTRSKTKRTRENLNRLPREVEAILPSWVKCTDPIPREILEEVRSTVTTWMKNVRNYVEETETYILNDEHTPQEIVDEGWAFFRIYCPDPYIYSSFSQFHSYADDDWRFATSGWSRFIRRMILSDVNIIHRQPNAADGRDITDIFVGSREENLPGRRRRGESVEYVLPDDGASPVTTKRGMLRLIVTFHDRLSSEIKDEICSKLASALRALKSRISRICGINELERRTQSLA